MAWRYIGLDYNALRYICRATDVGEMVANGGGALLGDSL
jgi:hypothetical protein